MATYHVNEIFCSLQGEGRWTGRPAIFLRFAGCNLRCPFCDTDHAPHTDMSIQGIMQAIQPMTPDFVVLTGGEPSLFIDDELIEALHRARKYVAVETNGTHPLPASADWVTLSPKDPFVEGATPVIRRCDELKLLFDGRDTTAAEHYADFPATHHYLQPIDTGDARRNKDIVERTVQYCLDNPQWSLSLQTHKIINIR